MPTQTHLVKRGNRYCLRRKIPRDVAHLVSQTPDLWKALTAHGGARRADWDLLIGEKGQLKTLIWISLMTSNHAEASERARAKDVEVDALCAEVRRTFESAQTRPKRPLSDQDVAQLARLWLHRREANLPVEERSGLLDDAHDYLEIVQDDLGAMSDFDDPSVMGLAIKQAERLVAEFGFDGKAGEALFNLLALNLAKGEVERLRRREARLEGKYEHRSFNGLFDLVDGVQEPLIPQATDVMTLGKLVDHYMADLDRRGASSKTKIGYRVIFGVLKELLGDDKPIKKINREDCRRVRDVLSALPPNSPKRFQGMKLVDVAAKAKEEGIPGRSPGTLRSYLINLTALFNYAVQEEYMASNPAKGLQETIQKVSKKSRWMPFSTEQLQKIFNAPLYRGCKDDERGYAVPGPNVIRRGRFWVPLLSLFHGIRENEACQLLVSDVIDVGGLTAIVMEEDESPGAEVKQLKTDAASRSVPLHPELVKMGFLRYLSEIRQRGEPRLFPELTVAATGYRSDNFSKWFGGFLEKCGAKEPRTSFHSFRHCFRDALRQAGISHDMVLVLGGWSGGGTDQDYGHGAGLLPTKAEVIAKVKYTGLDLSHLYE